MPDSHGNPSNNEDIVYVSGKRAWPLAPRPWFDREATSILQCPRCSNISFGVIVSDRPFIQIFCPDCQFAWGPMEMHKPQMTDSVAIDMGMTPAVKLQQMQEDMDIPNSELPE